MPPKSPHVPTSNCSPPKYPLPVLICQLPLDSQRAMASHTTGAAAAGGPVQAGSGAIPPAAVPTCPPGGRDAAPLVARAQAAAAGVAATPVSSATASTTGPAMAPIRRVVLLTGRTLG